MKLTKAECECLLHRLEADDCIVDCFFDSEMYLGQEKELYDAIDRLASQIQKGTLPDSMTAMERDIIVDCIDGSTWIAALDGGGDRSRQEIIAKCGVIVDLAAKIEKLLGLPANSLDRITS